MVLTIKKSPTKPMQIRNKAETFIWHREPLILFTPVLNSWHIPKWNKKKSKDPQSEQNLTSIQHYLWKWFDVPAIFSDHKLWWTSTAIMSKRWQLRQATPCHSAQCYCHALTHKPWQRDFPHKIKICWLSIHRHTNIFRFHPTYIGV